MKYDITYSCGHQGEVDLFGKSRDRERKVKYLETCICPACQTAQIRKEAEDAGLPELEGSEKQIRWALEIRASKIKYTKESIPELVSMIDKPIDERMASTIRHNRARGSHDVDLMSNIVRELHSIGRSDKWLAKHLGMDIDEITRLKQITGLADLFKDNDFSKSWIPYDDQEEK